MDSAVTEHSPAISGGSASEAMGKEKDIAAVGKLWSSMTTALAPQPSTRSTAPREMDLRGSASSRSGTCRPRRSMDSGSRTSPGGASEGTSAEGESTPPPAAGSIRTSTARSGDRYSAAARIRSSEVAPDAVSSSMSVLSTRSKRVTSIPSWMALPAGLEEAKRASALSLVASDSISSMLRGLLARSAIPDSTTSVASLCSTPGASVAATTKRPGSIPPSDEAETPTASPVSIREDSSIPVLPAASLRASIFRSAVSGWSPAGTRNPRARRLSMEGCSRSSSRRPRGRGSGAIREGRAETASSEPPKISPQSLCVRSPSMHPQMERTAFSGR